MTDKTSWLAPERVVEIMLPEVIDNAFIDAVDPEVNAMLEMASQPVHILVDTRHIKKYPSAQTSMKLSYYKHPRMGVLVMIGLTANPVLRFLGSLVARGAGIKIKDFSTRDEALAYLKAMEQIEQQDL